MATFLMCNGLDPVELHPSESYNKVRRRLTQARKNIIDYENGQINGEDKDQKFEPFQILSFKTADDGRFSVDPAKVIGVGSDEAKDTGTASDDDE